MIEKLQQILAGLGGRIVAVLIIIGCAVAILLSVRNFSGSEGSRATNSRPFIDAETGKTFDYQIKLGDTFPVISPYTGKRTGYHAEACYWTRDGKIKDKPTYVLLNKYVNKPGATFCPDCGRLVREMNDPPIQGAEPPPTEQEWKEKKARYRDDE